MPATAIEGHVIVDYGFQFCHFKYVKYFVLVDMEIFILIALFVAVILMSTGKKTNRHSSYSSNVKSKPRPRKPNRLNNMNLTQSSSNHLKEKPTSSMVIHLS